MAVFKANSRFTLDGSFTKSLDNTVPTTLLGINLLQEWTSGTGANQCNQWWADTRTTPAGAESHDLYGGLTNTFGETINFTTLKLIVIRSNSTTASDLLAIGGNYNLFFMGTASDVSLVWAGGLFVQTIPLNGGTITNGTQDTLTITPAFNLSQSYDIFLAGTV